MQTALSTTPARTEEMAVIHRIFRSGFPMTAVLVRQTPEGATARSEPIAAHLDFLLNGLHHHHSSEDAEIWPRLLDRAAPQAELITRMEGQHELVAERSEQVRTALESWRRSASDGELLATALDEFTAALVVHLDDEEANVVPLIRAHITAEEWNRFGQQSFEKFTNAEKLVANGTLEEVATPEEFTWFLGNLPLPIKLMWRLVGPRKHARYMRRVVGTDPAKGDRAPKPLMKKVLRAANGIGVSLYRRTNGRIGGKAKGTSVLLLTVAGRRTGTPFTVAVSYFLHDGDFIVCGSAGGMKHEPQWIRNLKAAGEARIQIGSEIHVVDGRVTDAIERDELWRSVVLPQAPFFAKYAEKSGRVIPVARLTLR